MSTWCPGVPQHPTFYGSALAPVGCVEHRTIGSWAGDYSVLSRGRVPSVHFLIGQAFGQWVQFLPINTTAAHAAGANTWAVGIEFSGQNGEPLTEWQLAAGRVVHQFLIANGIRPVFYMGGLHTASYWQGFLNHAQVATSPQYQHYDFINFFPEFLAMVADAPSAPAAPQTNTSGVSDSVIYCLENIDGTWLCRHYQGNVMVREFPKTPKGQNGIPQPVYDYANADPNARIPMRRCTLEELQKLEAAEKALFAKSSGTAPVDVDAIANAVLQKIKSANFTTKVA